MQGHDVVLRLDFDAHLEGRLITANDDVFVVRKPTGETVSIPRKSVRGLRLSETAAPALAPIARPQYSGGGRSYPGADSDGLDPVFRPRERSVGFGTAFGGGATSAGQGLSGALLLPTAELQIFLPGEYSIDLSMPVLNMALGSALIGGTLVGADIYFNVNAGKERTRLVAGPGIGFGYVSAQGQSAFSLKIPAQLGFEVLSKKRSFGFKMLARPWLELASGTYSSTFGGGVMAALVFSGYALSDRDSE
jgi:hypothetical protein